MVERKRWTLEEARAVLPRVIEMTEHAMRRASAIVQVLEGDILPENEQEAREEELQETVNVWATDITSLGAEVKGLWLVDFDHGSGYYCWKFGESDITHQHTYDGGFGSRQLIDEDR